MKLKAEGWRRRFVLASPSLRVQIARVRTIAELELEILRGMSAADKLNVAQTLWRQAWDLKTAGVRWLHPDWTGTQVEAEVRAIFGRDAA